jgi:hypothetical protein
MSLVTAINRERLAALVKRERGSYAANFPRSRAAFDGAGEHLLGGVPMTWMRMWAGGFPAYQATAHGARLGIGLADLQVVKAGLVDPRNRCTSKSSRNKALARQNHSYSTGARGLRGGHGAPGAAVPEL